MSKRIAFMLTGLSVAVSSVGCCCLGGYGYNKCNPCGGCPTGAYYAPQSTMVQSIDQTAYSSSGFQTATVSGATIGTPIMATPGLTTTQTVLVPTNTLPTY